MIITFLIIYFTQSGHQFSVAHELFLFFRELRIGQNRLRVSAESCAADSCTDTRPIHCSLRSPPVAVHVHHMSLHLSIPIHINIFHTTEGCFHTLKPSGHYMYHQFNIQQLHVLPTQCIYVFCVDLRTNSDYFPIQH
jgi:hypothetical protein